MHDMYSRQLVLDSLSSTILQSVELSDLVKSTRTMSIGYRTWIPDKKLKIYRHCNVQGQVIHLSNLRYEEERNSESCKECAIEHELEYHLWNYLSIEDYHYGRTILSDEIVPIFAGHLANGEKGYVMDDAGAEFRNPPFIHNSNKAKAAYRPRLLILRYASDVYPKCPDSRLSTAPPTDGMDATGPYSWKFVQFLPHISEVIESEEANTSNLHSSTKDDVLSDSNIDDASLHIDGIQDEG